MLKPAEAATLGIVDELLESADFLAESLRWASKVLDGSTPVERPEIDRGEAWDAALARGKAIADGRTAGTAPAPYRALELIALARTASFDDGIVSVARFEIEI